MREKRVAYEFQGPPLGEEGFENAAFAILDALFEVPEVIDPDLSGNIHGTRFEFNLDLGKIAERIMRRACKKAGVNFEECLFFSTCSEELCYTEYADKPPKYPTRIIDGTKRSWFRKWF
jgi:hypothetical protein